MNLMNKNGSWMYQDKAWNIPAESYDGGIENQDSGDVLGLLDNATIHGSMVDLQDKMRSLSESQRWTRDIADRSGWFKLKNPLSGKVLTAPTSSILTISGIKEKNIRMIKDHYSNFSSQIVMMTSLKDALGFAWSKKKSFCPFWPMLKNSFDLKFSNISTCLDFLNSS